LQIVGYINTNEDYLHGQKMKFSLDFRSVLAAMQWPLDITVSIWQISACHLSRLVT